MLRNYKKYFSYKEIKSLLNIISLRFIFLICLSLIIPLLLTYIVWRNAEGDIVNHAERSFKSKIEEASRIITKRMHAYEQVLLGGIGLFAASDTVTREEWKIYTENLRIEKNFHGILGIGYAYNLHHQDSLKFVSAIQREGFKNFQIWPEGKREEYSTVLYIEPFDERNQQEFGFDLLSDPIRKSAMLEARDNGQTIITGKISIVQKTEDNPQVGFIIYIPYYIKNYQATNVERRRELFKGYVYSPFIMSNLIRATFGNELENINFQIYDGVDLTQNNLMYDSDSNHTFSSYPLFTGINQLNMYGKTWSLKYTALPNYLSSFKSEKPAIVFFSGLLISILFFTVMMLFLKTKQTSQKLSGLLESTGEGIFGIDNSLKCTFINRSALSLLGYEINDCIGKNIIDFIKCTRMDNNTILTKEECPFIQNIKNRKAVSSLELILERKDKTTFPAEISSHPIFENKQIIGLVVTFTNITERLKIMEQIQNSLKEKDVLLREIHHRVKNNLQIISSLLNLQAGFIEDKRSVELFEESKNRVRSMALIHEKLYESKNFSSLNMREFIEELVKNLYKSFGFDTSTIELDLKIDDLNFNADQAVYLGLIINELVSNSFKHAFPNAEKSELKINPLKIFIYSEMLENCKVIRIGDTGKGFPPNVDYRNTESLGLQLVMTLVSQLGGEIELFTGHGTEFRIKLKQ